MALPNGLRTYGCDDHDNRGCHSGDCSVLIGSDGASHVLEGTIDEKDRTDVIAIHFKETPAHSSYDWHPDPEPQFVITLSGTLEFATPDGETFVVRPGDILLAEDHIGKGHKWRLIDDQPWRRAYVVLKPGAKDSFVAKAGS